jgi:predicted ATPase
LRECRYGIPPLSSQDLSGDRLAEDLRDSEAVALFTERARLVRPELELTPATLEAVVGICRRLDGLPLALELAASRVRMLEPEALLVRLNDRFRILTGGSREKLPHQRTLLASIEWSHDQLGETERILFRRLGIFAGGFALDSVESVCVDESLERWDVLDALSSLIDKSLIEPALHRGDPASAAPRYRMLETFREYAKQQSEATGESTAIRERFIHYWRNVARRAAENLTGPDADHSHAVGHDLGNIREAIRVALDET